MKMIEHGDDLAVRRRALRTSSSRSIAIAIALATASATVAAPDPPSAIPPALHAARAAFDRGDLDEASHRGAIAGVGALAAVLAAPRDVRYRGPDDRATELAAIAAAPFATGNTELLERLARIAGGVDRRTAIPAARAARTIARDFARSDPPDDIAPADVATWRAPWAELALRTDRWIELRVLAVDIAAALDPGGTGIDLAAALGDADPDFRRAVIAVVPAPVPANARSALANAVARDTDDAVALAAAQTLCFDLPSAPGKPILDALGLAGLQRIRALVGTQGDPAAIRDAARCLTADATPASRAALGTIKKRVRL